MNEQTVIETLSSRHGIDATDAVKDATRDWAEDLLPETREPNEQDWATIEATADAYAQDDVEVMVEDHVKSCDECGPNDASSREVLEHAAQWVPNAPGSVFTQEMLDVDPNLGK